MGQRGTALEVGTSALFVMGHYPAHPSRRFTATSQTQDSNEPLSVAKNFKFFEFLYFYIYIFIYFYILDTGQSPRVTPVLSTGVLRPSIIVETHSINK